jgi:hypothetical protein
MGICHRNHFFVFRNEHAQSSTLGPKLMFGVVSRNFFVARHPFRKRVSGCIQNTSFSIGTISSFFATNKPNTLLQVQNSCLGWFRAISLPHATHSENGCRGAYKAQCFATGTFLCFSQRTRPIHYFSSKTHVWGGFAQFLCRTSPIPKTDAGCHTKHEFLPPEPFLCFSQRTCPIHYFRSKTHVWGGFAQFRCRTSPISKTGVGVHTKQKFLPPEPFLRFSQRTSPIHYFRSKTHVWGGFAQFRCRTSPIPKTHVWGGFAQFRCRTSPIPKTGVGVHTKHEFCHKNHFFIFRNEHAQSTTLGPKLMFGVVSRNSVAARHPFRKRVSGAYKARVLPPEPFLRFSLRTSPIHYFSSKTHVWGGFAQFCCRTSPIPNSVVGVHTKHEFCHQNHFFVFRNEHAQSTTLGPKLMFGVVSCNFVAARHPFRKGCRGAYKARVFATGTFLCVSQRTCPIHYFRSKTHVWGGFAQFP